MNTYRIKGADRTTGKDRAAVLEAEDEKAAALRASSDFGMFVSKIELVPPPQVDTPAPPKPVAVQAYAAPVRPAKPPEYPAMMVVSILLRILGGLAMAVAALMCAGVVKAHADSGRDLGPMDVIILVPTIGGPFVAGLMLYALGELLSCIRDMAINSFVATYHYQRPAAVPS